MKFRTSISHAAQLVTLALLAVSCSPALAQKKNDPFAEDEPLKAKVEDPVPNIFGPDVGLDQLTKQLRIQVEWIELPHNEMTRLLAEKDPVKPKHYKSANAGPLRSKLADLEQDGVAKILETAIVMARSGQRAKVESVYEMIYPSEYDPPEPGTMKDKDGKVIPQTPTPPMPAAYECRNVGVTLEVDPVMGADGVTIDLNLNPEITYHADDNVMGKFEFQGNQVEVKMPGFYTVRINTSVSVIAGEYFLLGAMSPQDETGRRDPSRKVMMFAKADVIVSGLLPIAEDQ